MIKMELKMKNKMKMKKKIQFNNKIMQIKKNNLFQNQPKKLLNF